MPIATGEKLPSMTLRVITRDGPVDTPSDDLFSGRKVVVFGLPGAFTPTCSLNHLPGFLDNRDAFSARGVDDVICVSVNDHNVMRAWATSTGGIDKIRFIADWDGAFTKAIGMDIDLSGAGLGVRSRRYSMIVDDRVATTVNLEVARSEATVSGAAATLQQLD